MGEMQRWFLIPLSDRNWWLKNLIGGVVSFLPVVGWLAGGYEVEVIRNTQRGKPSMPEWDDWLRKFVDGLMVSLIYFVYLLVPMIIGLQGANDAAGRIPGLTGISGGSLFGKSILANALAFGFGAFVPFGIENFASSGSLKSAFQARAILRDIQKVAPWYILCYAVFLAVSWMIAAALQMLPAGTLLSSFANFYLQVVFSGIFAELHLEAKRLPG